MHSVSVDHLCHAAVADRCPNDDSRRHVVVSITRCMYLCRIVSAWTTSRKARLSEGNNVCHCSIILLIFVLKIIG